MKRTPWPVLLHGLRPAGKPDRCFYCDAPCAAEHKPGCAIRSRTVVIRTIVEHVIDVPEDWTESDILFRYNEGTWCGNNFADEFKELTERLEKEGLCSCTLVSREYVREATAEDETNSQLFVGKLPT